MHVLVTRPKSDGRKTVDSLAALGIQATLCPLIEIVHEPIEAEPIEKASALVATSRNALRALEASPVALQAARPKQLFVVGPGTEQIARSLHFKNVTRGPGRASELTPLVMSSKRSDAGPVAVLAGDVMAFDLPAALEHEGVKVLNIAAYRSIAADKLPSGAVAALKDGLVDAVLLMSPRTAETWGRLIARDDAPAAAAMTHICLSRAVADALPPDFKRGEVVVAAEPTLEEMLRATKRLADGVRSG